MPEALRTFRDHVLFNLQVKDDAESTVFPSEIDSTVLRARLDDHPNLVRGRLENGLEYVILPNATPPQRFEAHLEMHVGTLYLPSICEPLVR